MLVALPVREIEEPVADARGGPVGGDVGEARREERHGPVGGEGELGHGRAQELESIGQGIGVEREGAPVLEPLIERQVRRELVGTPAARVEPERLWRPECQRDLGAGLGREARGMEHVAVRHDARGRPGALADPAARQGRVPRRRADAVLHPDPEGRLAVRRRARGP